MSKLTLFPKDLTLHHQSEGEISPRLLQEHHEGLAFTLGKFLACFGFSLYFLNSLPIPFHPSTLLIFLFMVWFFFLYSLSFLIDLWLTKCLWVVETSPHHLLWCCCRSWSCSAVPAAWQPLATARLPAFGLMFGMVPSHDAETGTPVPWVSSGSACWSELGWALCETALVYVFELSRTGKQFSFLIFIEEWRCPPSPALLQPQKLLAPAGCCVRIISTVPFGRKEADFSTVCLILCGKKQQEHLLILFVLVAPCSRGHPAWLGRGCCFAWC